MENKLINNLDEIIANERESVKAWKEMAEVFKNAKDPEAERIFNESHCLKVAGEHERLAGLIEELKARREADRWIPISEGLPKKEGKCLVSTDFGDVCEDSFVDGIFVLYLGNVIAWRPLPESYKEEENG